MHGVVESEGRFFLLCKAARHECPTPVECARQVHCRADTASPFPCHHNQHCGVPPMCAYGDCPAKLMRQREYHRPSANLTMWMALDLMGVPVANDR